MDTGKICEFVMRLSRPVGIFCDQLPAVGGKPEQTGESLSAGPAAYKIEIDDGILTIVGELGFGEAENDVLFGLLFGQRPVFRSVVAIKEDGVGFFIADADRFLQLVLPPEIGTF